MGITPDYTKKATKNYINKFDSVTIRLPKGSKAKIELLTGLSVNKFVNIAVAEKLEAIEQERDHQDGNGEQEQTEI